MSGSNLLLRREQVVIRLVSYVVDFDPVIAHVTNVDCCDQWIRHAVFFSLVLVSSRKSPFHYYIFLRSVPFERHPPERTL